MSELISSPAPAIGAEQLRALTEVLSRYKAGKAVTEKRVIASENWWKLRNADGERGGHGGDFRSTSGWLHNVIVSKHADAMDAYPEPVLLPREEADRGEAQLLSSIIPCVLEQCDFEQVYSDVCWKKGRSGTGIYKVTWDGTKLNGLGDISITEVNVLNVFWEPGRSDIQKSRYFFHTELCDKDLLAEQYPFLDVSRLTNSFVTAKYAYDDAVSEDGKVTVIECYYHKRVGGRDTLQYVKYVGDQVLYATENDVVPAVDPITGIPGLSMAERGLYDHGKYPYVFDTLFQIEGSPCGYGYVDLCRSPQTCIDLLNTAFIKNAMVGSTPRYFSRADGGINEEEFLDLTRSVVHVNGMVDDNNLRQITFRPLDGVYVGYLDRMIQELRETSGNTETSTGNISSGVTAASAIVALQEASSKGSRDSNMASYRCFGRIVELVIELIRQFYDLPRQFRIAGERGAADFVTYTNAALKPRAPLYRLPSFDVKVSAQKRTGYQRVSQNELALQFFRLGFFDPARADQALLALNMMDFEGKDALMQQIAGR